jgi:hypothetical protein
VNDRFKLKTDALRQINFDGGAVKVASPVETAPPEGIKCGSGGDAKMSTASNLNANLYHGGPIWSKSEKSIARTAVDAALGRELHEVIQQTQRMANQIQRSSDLWNLERYLTQRRKEIDRKYEYHYSRLTDVLGRLLYENRLSEEDLRGLREDKMELIRSFVRFLKNSAA